ncbi:HlyD family type I secretion periplasmic adaptor subunit [soil metagenome]
MSAALRTADFDAGPHRAALGTVFVTAAFLVVALVWASLAHLDVSVSAKGAMIAPSRVQEIQSLEGGIVREMLVKPGQTVKQGDVLVRLEGSQFEAELGESQQSMLALRASRIRADALLAGTTPEFGAELEAAAPALVSQERRAWLEARGEYQAGITTAAETVRRQTAELAEMQARVQSIEASIRVARESLALEEKLFKDGAGARADYLAAQQRTVGLTGDLEAARKAVPKSEAALAEARAQAAQVVAKARAQWGSQRSEIEGKAATLATTLRGRSEKLGRREITSPMDGIVNRVLIPTHGGVAAAGAPILEIVPIEAGLRVNVRVKPSDIGFIHIGQTARVSVLAYDSAIYGKLGAVVERVGADAVLDENKQPYFEVQLRAEPQGIVHAGKQLLLTAGMTADTSILTGQRTVLGYLLKPLVKTFDSALQER